MATLKQLQHEYDRTRGLWCIDRKPTEVDYDWIKRNAFQLEHYLDSSEEGAESQITIGAFTLKQGQDRGKVWIGRPSGKGSEIDAKVLEDMLKSFF
jgi:hypothetical protein